MRLQSIDVRGYKGLSGRHELGESLTLVTGPNEAGKSTFHDALIHALFGFSPEERRRREGASAKDQRAPWSGGPFGLVLRLCDAQGLNLLVSWDFEADLVVVQDALTGESILREQPTQRHDFELGRRLSSMGREQFEQICCLYQGALETVRPGEELRASLQRSLESAPGQQSGVASADERLCRRLHTLGVHVGTYRALREGALQQLGAREQELQRELECARARRGELAEMIVDLDRARAREGTLSAHSVEQGSARSQDTEALERREQALRERRAELTAAQLDDEARLEPQSAPAAVSEPAIAGDPLLARFRARRDQLLEDRVREAQPSWHRGWLLGAVALVIGGLLGALALGPALLLLALAGLGCGWMGRPLQRSRPQEGLEEFEGHSFQELDLLAQAEERAIVQERAKLEQELGRVRERARILERERERIEGELADIYRQVGIDASELQAAGAAFSARTRREEAERRATRSELEQAQRDVERLQTLLGERERGLGDPADMEVELAQVRAGRERAELERDAIRIAREELQRAASETHRRVAPQLIQALRRELPRITRGRYGEGTVEEDLSIRLYAPESGNLVSVEQLSRGTRDQVALIQRLEIARLLEPSARQAPLLLDDPFAHFDSQRLGLAVELIGEVAQQRQVILFTEDLQVIEAVLDRWPGCALIELADPAGERAAFNERLTAVAGAAG